MNSLSLFAKMFAKKLFIPKKVSFKASVLIPSTKTNSTNVLITT